MCKILVISPYVGLKDLILEVNKELNKKLDVYVGNLYDGLAIAKSLDHRKYDVIISRGATAKLLQKHFTIPVMEIEMTGYDMLRTLTLLNGFSGKIGMMSYLNKIRGANMIGKLLNMDITFYPINEEREIEGQIEAASNDGVQLIIGDVISTTTAARFGIQGVLITSGKEAVIETILNAEQMVYYIQQEKEKVASFQGIFERVREGILIFDEYQSCTLMNEQAKKLFEFIEEIESFSISKLIEMVPKLEGLFTRNSGQSDEIITVKMRGETYEWTLVPSAEEPYTNGCALIVKKQVSDQFNAYHDHVAYFHFNSLVARSDKMKQLISAAKKISRSHLPIMIYGESGVGKDSFAQAIHNYSDRGGKPYVFVNCEAYSATKLESELFGKAEKRTEKGLLEMANGGTIFIDAIDSMPFHLQGKLHQVITNGQMSRLNGVEKTKVDVRVIAAMNESLHSKVEEGYFRYDLYQALNGFSLKVPPLRERMEDLEDLVRLFIASANVTIQKQISGLQQPVIDELKKLKWTENIRQLKYVIEQMCFISEGPFIEKEEVHVLLQRLKREEQAKEKELSGIQIHDKTLYEIEQEVILAVLKEEDDNQSKTAKRLGINRSTLWRKIKHLT
ncbi:AAA domain-containing protein [bacterium LRH843]|nr:AAA domain-containing protein [bacterium LRH843]